LTPIRDGNGPASLPGRSVGDFLKFPEPAVRPKIATMLVADPDNPIVHDIASAST
jgi:hypothetical protein